MLGSSSVSSFTILYVGLRLEYLLSCMDMLVQLSELNILSFLVVIFSVVI
jgi:hypothetical protein